MKLTRACNSADLARLTGDGWQVVARVDHAQRIATERYESKPAGNYTAAQDSRENGGNGYKRWFEAEFAVKAEVITDPLFILEKESEYESVEKGLRLELDTARGEIFDANRNTKNAITEHKKALDEIEGLNLSIDALKKQNKVLVDSNASIGAERKQLQAEVAALKTDLDKVRKEVGEGRWRAISQEMGLTNG